MIEGDDTAPLGPEDADDALAAEYVLRLLDPAEETAARLREASDTAFAERVARWRDDLGQLDAEFAIVMPPPRLWSRLDRRLFAPLGDGAGVAEPRRGFGLWRGFALAAALVAAVALGFLLAPVPVGDTPSLVSALAPVEGQAEFLALVEPEAGTLRINRVSGEAGPGRTFQLWLVEEGGAPVSLGLLPDDPTVRLALDPALAGRLQPGVTLAVSLEPAGGSSTGAPTGPVVAAGPARVL